ncbi:MAG: hypothetical protein ACRDJW_09175 [Thermomicrobiales bacterium]
MSIKANTEDSGTPDNLDSDDIEAYIATLDEQARRNLATAEAEIDKAILRHRTSKPSGPSRVTEHFGTITPRNRPENWRAGRQELERLMAIDIAAEDRVEEQDSR